jgi:putative NADH-flavin reductase
VLWFSEGSDSTLTLGIRVVAFPGESFPMKWTILICVLVVTGLVACSGEPDSSSFGKAAPQLASQASAKLRILIIGGTSGVGLEVVKLALKRGHHVIAMARSPERITLSHKNLDTIKGDILDITSVTDSMVGADAVVIAIGTGPTRKPVSVFSQGTANVLIAMKKQDVQRLIEITGIGAGNSRGHGGLFYDKVMQPLLLSTVYEDKDRAEALIFESESKWTIVRPGFLNDDVSEKKYRVIEDVQGVTSGSIARADVAHFIVSALEMDNHIGDTVLLTN